MSDQSNQVTIVVEEQYGDRLFKLLEHGPVWIVDTPVNRAVAEIAWAQATSPYPLTGVTTFKSVEGMSAEEKVIAILDTVDLHHNEHSAEPPYSVLEIVGAPMTLRLKLELSKYRFNEVCGTQNGVRAVRLLGATKIRRE